MVQHVEGEAVGGQHVAHIVTRPQRPVLAQALRREHEHASVAQFEIFDDGQGLEGFAQPYAVGDNAAAEPLQLVYGADDAVLLEAIEL
jgi:hypothetical protein